MSALRRIFADEISARAPLPFAVFDRQGRQLYPAGVVIGSIGYTQYLIGRGLYRCDEPEAPRYARDAPRADDSD
ncbi:MAG: hypothetical protein KDG52_07150 [Rhodocyclaceae bacterium]|nr:hypothetical protein [Rhodocyclaceae bacterium]